MSIPIMKQRLRGYCMLKRWLATLKEEILSFSGAERLFILFAMLSGTLISAEYAIIRPVSNAVFLTTYGSDFLPYAWLVAVPANFLLVTLYNRYLPTLGCMRMFVVSCSMIVGFNLFSALALRSLPCLAFIFYVWKDIYIMFMFQQLWSVIHSTISFRKAKYLYGIFFATGAFGALVASILPGFFAVKMGSETLLLASLPLYTALGFCYHYVLKFSGVPSEQKTNEGFLSGFKLVLSSKLLMTILAIVCFMQLSATLIDFQFNAYLEKSVTDKDLRTQYTAQLLFIVHFVSIALQLLGSFICIQLLGVKRSHLLVPGILLFNAALFQCFPLFFLISFSFVCVKSFDFSLFTVIKELLYIPLTQAEKFRAKAVIDVFAHRSSKAVASVVILGLKVTVGYQCLSYVGWFATFLFILWMGVVALRFKEPQAERAL